MPICCVKQLESVTEQPKNCFTSLWLWDYRLDGCCPAIVCHKNEARFKTLCPLKTSHGDKLSQHQIILVHAKQCYQLMSQSILCPLFLCCGLLFLEHNHNKQSHNTFIQLKIEIPNKRRKFQGRTHQASSPDWWSKWRVNLKGKKTFINESRLCQKLTFITVFIILIFKSASNKIFIWFFLALQT